MFRIGSLFLAIACLASLAAADGLMVKRCIGGGNQAPGIAEIHEVNPDNMVSQSFVARGIPVAGMEFYAARYPKDVPCQLTFRLRQDGHILRSGLCSLPLGSQDPVRVTFPPLEASERLWIDFWVEDGAPGRSARMLFFPVEHYPEGVLLVGGEQVAGDLLFRILTPATSSLIEAVGMDQFQIQGRFPSSNLADGTQLVQEFVVPADSLASLEFLMGTGGRDTGPVMRWELTTGSSYLGCGIIAVPGDNVVIRISFPFIARIRGSPLSLKLAVVSPWDGDLRAWLCPRAPGTGALVVADRLLDASLVLRSIHVVPAEDSLQVAIAAMHTPVPMPGPAVAGGCELKQEFLWPEPCSPHDLFGIRLAVGGGMVAGSIDYSVLDMSSNKVVWEGCRSLSGLGADDFLWLPLGWPHTSGPLQIRLKAPGTRAENAARFWWMPMNIYPAGDASGCVPSAGGDCIFRLARRYSIVHWLTLLPSVSLALSRGHGGEIMAWLIVVRIGMLVVAGVAVIGGAAHWMIGFRLRSRK